MNILRMGETTHGSDFCVLRPNGYPHYLLIMSETPAMVETEEGWRRIEAGTALLFRPGQRHSYRAAEGNYRDCWMHIGSTVPLLFDGFPFGRPVALHSEERFYQLFRILLDEFFSVRRSRESILNSLAFALIEMLGSEVEVRDALFYPLLALREAVFRTPAEHWNAAAEAEKLGVSCGYFHVLYKRYFCTTFLSDVVASRIQAAEELLISTRSSVGRVAELCGYWNTEHFIRQFRRATGMTPHRYRNSCAGGL